MHIMVQDLVLYMYVMSMFKEKTDFLLLTSQSHYLWPLSLPARGVSIAQSMSSKQVKRECATILEGLKVREADAHNIK